jgi:hypothetical protein
LLELIETVAKIIQYAVVINVFLNLIFSSIYSLKPPDIVKGVISTQYYKIYESADYIIETDGILYYVIDTRTSRVVKSSNKANDVIQYAVNSLINGGKIYIKTGNYILYEPVLIQRNNIIIEGESYTTVLRIIKDYDVVFRIGLENSTNKICENVTIRNLTLDGGYPTVLRSTGLSISACDNVLIENVYFRNSGERNWISAWSENEHRKKI